MTMMKMETAMETTALQQQRNKLLANPENYMEERNMQEGQGEGQGEIPASTPPPSTSQSGGESPKQGPVGPIVGVIIIVAVLVLGGLYYWGTKLNEQRSLDAMSGDEIENLPDEQLEDLQVQDTSDTIESIGNDLDATDLENLDAELEQIDADLGL